jgi:ribosomal protein L16 Arg81 hydroxylase
MEKSMSEILEIAGVQSELDELKKLASVSESFSHQMREINARIEIYETELPALQEEINEALLDGREDAEKLILRKAVLTETVNSLRGQLKESERKIKEQAGKTKLVKNTAFKKIHGVMKDEFALRLSLLKADLKESFIDHNASWDALLKEISLTFDDRLYSGWSLWKMNLPGVDLKTILGIR